MKTVIYNPSTLEVSLATILFDLKEEISQRLPDGFQIVDLKKRDHLDNPDLLFKIQDADGDVHELIVRTIQRIEQ